MSYIRLISIFCFVLLSLFSSVQPGLITAQRFVKDGRVVILFGDQHDSLHQEENGKQWNSKVAAQWKAINTGLETYEKFKKNEKPLIVFYELEGSEIKTDKDIAKVLVGAKEFKLNNTLINFKFVNKEPFITCTDIEKRNCHFLLKVACKKLFSISELRFFGFKKIENVFNFQNKIENDFELKFELWLSSYTLLQNSLLDAGLLLKNKTLKTLYNSCTDIFENALKDNSQGILSQVIENDYARYKKAYTTFLNDWIQCSQTMKLSEETDLYDYFVRSMIDVKLEDAIKLLESVNQFGINGLFLVNDIATIIEIEKDSTKNCAVFVGDKHRKNIAQKLLLLGYTCEICRQVDPKTCKRTFDFSNKESEINNLLAPEVITDMISGMIVDKNEKTIASALNNQDVHNEKKCNVCGKAGVKRCGQCKKAHYCSQECQRKDWTSHKKTCKK